MSSNPTGLHGAVTRQEDLIGLRFQGRFQLSSHKRSLSVLAGPYGASFRGRGMDFEEVRAYQAGDDVRAIDWRVTARTGDPHTKVYKEERERPVFVITDQRSPMFFGSRVRFKSVLAAEIAGVLAWSALKQNDRVGGLILGSTESIEVRPKRSKSSVLKLLHGLNEQNNRLSGTVEEALRPDGESSPQTLNEALEDARRLNKTGSAIFIISDFHDFNEDTSKQLYQLSRHNEVTAFLVYDPLEAKLPPAGTYEVTDGQSRGLLRTRDKTAQRDYNRRFSRWHSGVQKSMSKSGVPLVSLATNCDVNDELMKYYAVQRGR